MGAALLVTAAACGDGGTGPEAIPEGMGRVELRLTGATTHSFSVTAPPGSPWEPMGHGSTDAFMQYLGTGPPVLVVTGIVRTGEEERDRVRITVPSAQEGTYSIPSRPSEVQRVRGVAIWLDEDHPFGGSAAAFFRMESGVVRIVKAEQLGSTFDYRLRGPSAARPVGSSRAASATIRSS